MIIDSHFHPLSMAKKGITDLPENITGIAIGTEPGEAEMMIASLSMETGSHPQMMR